MGKGLSPLQKDILAALGRWPLYEQAMTATPGQLDDWAFPRDIIEHLRLPKSGVTSVSVSRALSRL